MSALIKRWAKGLMTLTTAGLLSYQVCWPTTTVSAAETADVTMLVYMNGSPLESQNQAGAASMDLIEMMKIGSTAQSNVIVETGGTSRWIYPNISGQANQRWLVKEGKLELLSSDLGARSMGDPATLTNFISWGIESYPAKKYALILWNHESDPVSGYGADELFDHDSLLLSEFETALRDAYRETGARFELVGFDAPLMASVETASVLKKYANYLVTSGLGTDHSWNYMTILHQLVNRSDWDEAALDDIMASGNKLHAFEQQTAGERTLSVVELRKIADVEEALDILIQRAASDLLDPLRIQAIAKARSGVESFNGKGVHGGMTDIIDLADLTERASSLYPNETALLAERIRGAVVYNSNSELKSRLAGLFIYFPYKDNNNLHQRLRMYGTLPFSPSYRNFIESYMKEMMEDKQAIRFEQKTPQAIKKDQFARANNFLYRLSISQEDLDQVAEAYSILAAYHEGSDDSLIFLGMDDTVSLDKETGTLEDTFTGRWVMLNGHFVSMFLSGYEDDHKAYTIPAKLNGDEIRIIVSYNAEEGVSKIGGAWRATPESGMVDKSIIKMKQGDQITPMYYTYNQRTNESGFLEGESFTVEGELTLEPAVVPEGRYLYGFYVTDFAQNESYSDFLEIDWRTELSKADDRAETLSNEPDSIQVTIDGKLQQYEQPPVWINDKTMVPLRAIFEALGATLEWDGETGTVTAHKDDTIMVLRIGSDIAAVNGKEVKLPQAVVLVNGHSMVPVRFVSEALGAHVDWDHDMRRVIIKSR